MSLEQRWQAAEADAEAKRRRRARRQPLLLIALLDVLLVAVASTAVVDLRRLATPQGTALAWTQAAVFGDCGDYLRLSIPDPTVADRRTPEQLCTDLRAATRTARTNSARIALRPVGSTVRSSTATVRIELDQAAQPRVVVLELRRSGGGWRVLRDAQTCGSVGCA